MGVFTARAVRANRELREAKTRLEQQQASILESVAEGIYGVDPNGHITFVNRPLLALTGWSAEELAGADQHALLHASGAEGEPQADGHCHGADDCPVRLTVADNRPRFVDDGLFRRRDGSVFPVEYTASPIRDPRGRILGTVVVFRDMTERRQAHARARRHESDLAHVARLNTLGEMASGLAHELNQPLTAIAATARACVRILEAGRTGERCADAVARIADEAERAGEVIRQVRRFARNEAPERVPTPLSAILEGVAGMLLPEARQTGVALVVEVPEPAPWVLAQSIQIEQVLLNLARNAIEAMAETPAGHPRRLTLSARLAPDRGTGAGGNDRAELAVIDTGPGLPSELALRVFEPFVSTKPQGLGLGLSIGARIVESHGSALRVASTPGAGARFSFDLPIVPPS